MGTRYDVPERHRYHYDDDGYRRPTNDEPRNYKYYAYHNDGGGGESGDPYNYYDGRSTSRRRSRIGEHRGEPPYPYPYRTSRRDDYDYHNSKRRAASMNPYSMAAASNGVENSRYNLSYHSYNNPDSSNRSRPSRAYYDAQLDDNLPPSRRSRSQRAKVSADDYVSRSRSRGRNQRSNNDRDAAYALAASAVEKDSEGGRRLNPAGVHEFYSYYEKTPNRSKSVREATHRRDETARGRDRSSRPAQAAQDAERDEKREKMREKTKADTDEEQQENKQRLALEWRQGQDQPEEADKVEQSREQSREQRREQRRERRREQLEQSPEQTENNRRYRDAATAGAAGAAGAVGSAAMLHRSRSRRSRYDGERDMPPSTRSQSSRGQPDGHNRHHGRAAAIGAVSAAGAAAAAAAAAAAIQRSRSHHRSLDEEHSDMLLDPQGQSLPYQPQEQPGQFPGQPRPLREQLDNRVEQTEGNQNFSDVAATGALQRIRRHRSAYDEGGDMTASSRSSSSDRSGQRRPLSGYFQSESDYRRGPLPTRSRSRRRPRPRLSESRSRSRSRGSHRNSEAFALAALATGAAGLVGMHQYQRRQKKLNTRSRSSSSSSSSGRRTLNQGPKHRGRSQSRPNNWLPNSVLGFHIGGNKNKQRALSQGARPMRPDSTSGKHGWFNVAEVAQRHVPPHPHIPANMHPNIDHDQLRARARSAGHHVKSHPEWHKVAGNAVKAAATTAWANRDTPGPWMGPKGARVAGAMLTVALTEKEIMHQLGEAALSKMAGSKKDKKKSDSQPPPKDN